MNRFVAVVFATLLFWSTSASATKAEPITATIIAVTSWVAAQGAVAVAIFNALNIALASAAVSMLQRALMGSKRSAPPGIKLERTATGGAIGRRAIIGRYASAGSEVCPPMSHGADGKTPNAYLTKVIAYSDVPVDGLRRVMIGGEYVTLGANSEYGSAVGGKYAGHAWVKFHNGEQLVADTMLVAKYSSYLRPWTSRCVGTGVAYGVFTFKYNPEVFKSEPEVKVEVDGMRMYDPRKDDTVGGSGSHRWGVYSTYGPTLNPVVMIYNIKRGIDVGGGYTWGGECTAEDLPLSNWVAAMNVCDEAVPLEPSGFEPRYRAGYEIDLLQDEPADVIEELLKACSGNVVEIGGIYKIRCGPPSLPVMFFTDEDFIVTRDQDYNPFPEVNAMFNGVNCVFPHPDATWNTHDAPPLKDDTYVAEDDGIDLIASLQMPSCPYPLQVQRNMRAWLLDNRRARQHSATVGPYAWALEPLDVVSWTSARNGYVDKLFEIDATDENTTTLSKRAQLREVDPTDYDWLPSYELPDPVTPGSWDLPDAQIVPGWGVQPWSINDSDGNARRPALRLFWDGDGAEDATALKVQVRLIGSDVLLTDTTIALIRGDETIDPPVVGTNESIVSEGILAVTTYEARAQYVVDRATLWSDWMAATTANILLSDKDVDIDDVTQAVIDEVKEQFKDLDKILDGLDKEAETDIEVILNEHAEREIELRRRVEDVRQEQRNRQENIAEVNTQIQIVKDDTQSSVERIDESIAATNEAVAIVRSDSIAYTDELKSYTQTNFTTVSAFNDGLAATLSSSKTYTDAYKSEAALTYVTQTAFGNGMAETLVDAKSYTDAYKSEAALTFSTITQLNNGLATTLNTSKSYTDGQVSSAMNTVYTKAQVDASQASTLQEAKSYTDGYKSEASLTFATKAERANGDAATLVSAKSYTDDYKSTANLTFATKAERANGDATTLVDAKSYTDDYKTTANLTFATKTERANGDAATLVSAKSYTDDYKSEAALTFATQSTVSGVSSTASIALVTATDAVTLLGEARLDLVTAASGGNPAVVRLYSETGGESNVMLDADQISFGPNTTHTKANALTRTIVGSNQRVLAWGAPFGVGGKLLEWWGPASVAISAMTTANGVNGRMTDAPYVFDNSPVTNPFKVYATASAVSGSRTGAGTVTSSSVTFYVTGAVGPVTFIMYNMRGDPTIVATNTNSADPTAPFEHVTAFRATVGIAEVKTAEFVCSVRDASGATGSAYVSAALTELT